MYKIWKNVCPLLRSSLGLVVWSVLWSVSRASIPVPDSGTWRFVMHLREGVSLPFIASFSSMDTSWEVTIHNGTEEIRTREVRVEGDSLVIALPVFNTAFKAGMSSSREMQGYWYNYTRKTVTKIPFEAAWGETNRFGPPVPAKGGTLAPRYAVVFSPGTADAYPAVGEFRQKGGWVTGTFLTETGDYRYLEGVFQGRSLKLSAFDGSHVFLFTAEMQADGSLAGQFYSGSTWIEPWTGVADPQAALRDPDSLTYLRPGYDRLAFSLPDVDGRLVSLTDPKYRNKVVIVQLMGSWCPNCMDESRLLTQWYEAYHDQGLEIVGLAFERAGDTARAWQAIQRMKTHLGIPYPVLLAAVSSDKAGASAVLPMINQLMAYPTAIYIDRKGRVRRIHTGFAGPGTGEHHVRFVEQYSTFINQLLGERP
ncbi:MAG: TlpA disulfide reductase family protein [Bacteroidia bacterium]|nr:TlpA disulfide reductase family protein [Bacteroidia bacterium]